MRQKVVLINVIVLVIVSAAVLAGAEAYLRLSLPESSGGSIFEYTTGTSRYKVMRKDARVSAWGVELRTNDLGFRDNRQRIPPKESGEFRIIVLGDSFTVSAGVEFDRIYTSLLESELRARFPHVRVINLAVGGYNIVQYQMVLEEVGLSLDPDMVLVSVFPENDFSTETYDENRLVATGAMMPSEQPWHKRLYVWRAYLWRLEAITSRLAGSPPVKRTGKRTAAGQGWAVNVAALEEIAAMARERGLILAVPVLPTTWDFSGQRDVFKRFEQLCADSGITSFNMLEPFMAEGIPEKSLRLNIIDSHPNELYNRLLSGYLAGRVMEIYDGRNGRQAPIRAGRPGPPVRPASDAPRLSGCRPC